MRAFGNSRPMVITACLITFAAGIAGRKETSGAVSQGKAAAEIRVTLLGTGNPRPSIDRFGPSTLVEAGKVRLLVDAGRGTSIRLFQVGGNELLAGIDMVLLTHLHSDHVVGFPDLWLTGWIFGRQKPLAVCGPAGTVAMMEHLRQAFSFDITTRRDIDEHFAAAGIEMKVTDVGPGVLLQRDGVNVTAFLVDHGPVAPDACRRSRMLKRLRASSHTIQRLRRQAWCSHGSDRGWPSTAISCHRPRSPKT